MTAVHLSDPHLDPFTPDTRTWHDDAACAEACRDPRDPARPDWWDVPDPDLSDPDDDHLAALDVCAPCPVIAECLDAADPRHDRYSVRGGMLPAAWRTAKRESAA